jgi:hypothetical protein
LRLKCEKCGKEYKLGMKDKGIRAINVQLIGSVSKLAPGIGEDLGEKSGKYCTDCWRAAVNETNKQLMGIAQGKMDEAENTVKKKKG